MNVSPLPLSWYVDRLRAHDPFSLGHYGDGELIAIFEDDVGGKNAEGTVYTPELCKALQDSLRFKDERFLFAVPTDLHHVGLDQRLDKYLDRHGLRIDFVDKNVWNTEMREGRLGPFIAELRKHPVCIVSNKALRRCTFLNYDRFVEVGYPNCYGDILRAIEECLAWGREGGVVIVAMGLAGPVFVQALHGKIAGSFVIEVGSIFDTFCGIGGQRGFRKELYTDPDAYEAWWDKTFEGLCT